MRRISLVLAAIMVLTLVLAACGGKKDAAGVVKDLDQKVGKMTSYQGTGVMTIHTGQQPQEYQVDVSYQQPHFYRVKLTNEKQDITQIVLRNQDGVFVLTPHLNKTFRFQSNWPDNQGQVYLFHSLAQSIIADKDRQFTLDKGAYVFDVAANYQNSMLARQKIWLDEKTLAPKHVQVMDSNSNVIMEVDFTKFEFGAKFDKDSFDTQRNMTSMAPADSQQVAKQDAQGAAKAGDSGKTAAAGSKQDAAAGADAKSTAAGKGAAAGTEAKGTAAAGKDAAAAAGKTPAAGSEKQTAASDLNFGIIYPSYTPKGVKAQPDESQIAIGSEKAVLLRFSGTYHYNLVEMKPEARETYLVPGDVVDLGYTIAVLSGDDKKTLIWTYDGVEYRLSTADLPQNEMIKVAQAVQGQLGK